MKKRVIITYTFSLLIISFTLLLGGHFTNSFNLHFEKNELVQTAEKAEPSSFLQSEGTYVESFFGNIFKIDCKLINMATVVAYKDIVLEVTYYSNSKIALAKENLIISEVIKPKSEKNIKLKIDNHHNVATIDWKVIGAQPF